MEVTIRPATPEDAAAIARIYGHYVLHSPATFDLVPPTADEIAHKLHQAAGQYPWFVAEISCQVVGYAYAGRHRERSAYRWAADVSIYLAPDTHRKGLGRQLYSTLLTDLKEKGFYRALAGITLPNEASVGLHQAMGFTSVGIYHRIGFKLGAWHDTSWWELELRPTDPEPISPQGIPV